MDSEEDAEVEGNYFTIKNEKFLNLDFYGTSPNMKGILANIVLLALLAASCDFQSTGTNYVEVDPNFKPAEIEIVLPAESDTIFHSTEYVFNFHYSLSGQVEKLSTVFVHFDTTMILQSHAAEQSFIKPPSNLIRTDSLYNYHTITLTATAHSGTGSLADLSGAEGTVYQRTWVLCLYDKDAFKPAALNFETIDGRLRISWTKYPFTDLENYVLEKSIRDVHPFEIRFAAKSNINDTVFYDDSYVGEEAVYFLRYRTRTGKEIYSPETEITGAMSELYCKTISDNSVEISWNRCEFDKAFDLYQLSLQTSDGTFKEDITDINQTKKVYQNFPVGEKGTFSFYIKPRTTHNGYSVQTGRNSFFKHVFIGEEWFGFKQMVNAGDRYVYLQGSLNNSSKVYLYDNTGQKMIDSATIDNHYDNAISKSPNGKHVLIKDNLNVKLVGTGELNNGEVFTSYEITGRTEGYEYINYSISENLIGGFSMWGYLYLYDLKNRKLLDSIKATTNNIFQQISFDGKYIVLFDNNELNLYRYDNGELALIREMPSNSSAFFIPGTNELVCYDADNMTYKILDCNSNTFIRTLSIDKPILSCDFPNDRALVRDVKVLRILNLLGDNRVIKELSVNVVSYNTVNNGDYIYFPTGIKMRITN